MLELLLFQAKEQKKQNSLLVLACARGYIGDVSAILCRRVRLQLYTSQ